MRRKLLLTQVIGTLPLALSIAREAPAPVVPTESHACAGNTRQRRKGKEKGNGYTDKLPQRLAKARVERERQKKSQPWLDLSTPVIHQSNLSERTLMRIAAGRNRYLAQAGKGE